MPAPPTCHGEATLMDSKLGTNANAPYPEDNVQVRDRFSFMFDHVARICILVIIKVHIKTIAMLFISVF